MAKRYRLHLSDGTILVVDRDSLNTWLADSRATVQIEGSKQWLPLREFIAAEREAEFRASPRRTAKTREELPLIPPPPKKSDKEAASPEPAKPAFEPAPVTPPPPPREEPAPPSPPTPAPLPREEPAPWNPPTPVPPPREEPAPWNPPTPAPPPREESPPWAPPTPAPPPREEPPPWAQPTPPPPPREEPAPRMPQQRAPERSERPRSTPPEPLAGPVVTSRKSRSRPVARPDDSIQPIPLVPLDETPATRAIPLAQEPAQPDPHADAADTFAAEDRERGAAETYGQDLPVIPLKPLPDDARTHAPQWLADEAARDEELDQGFAEPTGPDLRHADVVFLRIMGVFGGFLSRLLETVVRYERQQRSRRAAARSAPATRRSTEPAQPVAPARSTEPSRAARAWQGLSEQLGALSAKVGAWRQTKTPGGESQSLGQLLASAIPRPAHKPKANAKAPQQAPAFDETFEALPAEEVPRRPLASTRLEPPPSRPAGPPPVATKPPPALHELPVLRLAEIPRAEEEEEGDLYEGEYELPGAGRSSLLSGLWRWTKRLVVAAVLVVGGLWAALTWKTWFPRAGEVGERALATIDQQVRSLETEKARQEVLKAGIEQMPQLAPETIQLVLSSNTSRAPDVLQLFEAANDAAERGRASLTRAEGGELSALREELLDGLPPAERDQVREYERARAFGLALPSEDRTALALLARGARSLPPERLARLRTVLGKAIAAGLTPPSPAATP